MMENLYLDKLKMRITESEYDKFYVPLQEKLTELNARLSQLEQADKDYYIRVKYLLDLSNRASELFEGSEVNEKRQLIKLVLPDLRLEGKKLVFVAQNRLI